MDALKKNNGWIQKCTGGTPKAPGFNKLIIRIFQTLRGRKSRSFCLSFTLLLLLIYTGAVSSGFIFVQFLLGYYGSFAIWKFALIHNLANATYIHLQIFPISFADLASFRVLVSFITFIFEQKWSF